MPLEIARFMGHTNVTTTFTVYTHLYEDEHADAMDALARCQNRTGGTYFS